MFQVIIIKFYFRLSSFHLLSFRVDDLISRETAVQFQQEPGVVIARIALFGNVIMSVPC